MKSDITQLIQHYQLEPLPAEQTLFKSTYRSRREYQSGKPAGTAIIALYCAEPASVSLFHRLPEDEIWHFYAGDPFRLVLLYADGSSEDVIMGSKPLAGQHVQFTVPAGVWQAGHMIEGGEYSLFGCTMAPGFTDDMYEGGLRANLLSIYPDRQKDIELLGCAVDQTYMPEGSAR